MNEISNRTVYGDPPIVFNSTRNITPFSVIGKNRLGKPGNTYYDAWLLGKYKSISPRTDSFGIPGPGDNHSAPDSKIKAQKRNSRKGARQ